MKSSWGIPNRKCRYCKGVYGRLLRHKKICTQNPDRLIVPVVSKPMKAISQKPKRLINQYGLYDCPTVGCAYASHTRRGIATHINKAHCKSITIMEESAPVPVPVKKPQAITCKFCEMTSTTIGMFNHWKHSEYHGLRTKDHYDKCEPVLVTM